MGVWKKVLTACLTACLTALEAALAAGWIRMSRYVEAAGAAENPYAAEDMEIAGICALALLPLCLAALAWAVYRVVIHCKKRVKTQ